MRFADCIDQPVTTEIAKTGDEARRSERLLRDFLRDTLVNSNLQILYTLLWK